MRNWLVMKKIAFRVIFIFKMVADKIGKISMFSNCNEHWYLGLFWSEELIGIDENCIQGHFYDATVSKMAASKIVKLSVVSDWYLGVFWSEKLVGNDENCIHMPEFWYESRLGTSVSAPKHNQTSLLLLFSFLSFRGTWTCPRQISGTTVQLCGKGVQSHILMGSKGMGVTIESYGKDAISHINVDNF
jgi:hypothetical protein